MRVLLIADSAIARAGLEAALLDDGRFELVGHGPPGNSHARASLRSDAERPDVILAEISDKRRLWSLLAPGDADAGPPVVLLLDECTRTDLLRLLSAGARAVLPSDAAPPQIFAALEAAAAGLSVLGGGELDLLLPVANSLGPEDDFALDALSPREVEVLALMAQGLANKNIADRLQISEHTVKFHVSSILAKLGAASRTEAVSRGLKKGLLVI